MTKEELEKNRKETYLYYMDLDFGDRNKLSFIIEKLSKLKDKYGDILLEIEGSEYSFHVNYIGKETDEQVIKRIEEDEKYRIFCKEQRKQQYLQLKEEFKDENI